MRIAFPPPPCVVPPPHPGGPTTSTGVCAQCRGGVDVGVCAVWPPGSRQWRAARTNARSTPHATRQSPVPRCAGHCPCQPSGSPSALPSFLRRLHLFFLLFFFLRFFLLSLACLLGLLPPWSPRRPHADDCVTLRLRDHQHQPPPLRHRLRLPGLAPLPTRVRQAQQPPRARRTAVPQPMSGAPGISTGSGPAATLFITSGARPLRLATAAIIASLLSGVYPLGRSPSCRVVSAVLTICGRLGTCLPRLLPVPCTLISAHPCSHSSVERCSSRCYSVIDLSLSKRSPGSGILHSSVGPYMNALAVFTAR